MIKLIIPILIFSLKIHSQVITNTTNNIPFEYEMVQIKPQYPGGESEFIRFITRNFVSPQVEGLSGIVTVTFIIETDGEIKDIKILKDIGSGAGLAAVNLMKKSPKWSAGQINGNVVRVHYTLAITVKNE